MSTTRNTLYNKLIGLLTKNGKKIKIKRILDTSLKEVSRKNRIASAVFLQIIFKRLNTFVEARTVRFRRRTQVVPFQLNNKRRTYLAAKWIFFALQKNKKRINLSQKLQEELSALYKKGHSKAMEARLKNNSDALRFRSNLHYRW